MKEQRIAVALGDFDGMHLAHQTVVTGAGNTIIYCVNNRFSLLQKSIFERRYQNVVFADFDAIKNMEATDFIDSVLIGEFGAGILLCGYNFRFGKGAAWTAMNLREYLEKKDVWVRILEHQDYHGAPISSSRIRECLKAGAVTDANAMLGYCFTYESEVIQGDGRGRQMGFPTVNQRLPQGLTVPKYGVYESRTEVDGVLYKSVTNIGIRPSFELKEPLSETHIFDYDGDLYGKTVRVELIRYIREERRFDSMEELKEQLTDDKSSIV